MLWNLKLGGMHVSFAEDDYVVCCMRKKDTQVSHITVPRAAGASSSWGIKPPNKTIPLPVSPNQGQAMTCILYRLESE